MIIGLHTHNRPLHGDSEKILGCFLNSIPFLYQFPRNITWADHLKAVNDRVVQLGDYNDLSLMEISKLHANKEQGQNENPFFDTLFGYLDFHVYSGLVMDNEDFSETFEKQEIEAQGQGINNTFLNFIVNATLDEFNLLIFYKSTEIDQGLLVYLAELFEEGLRKIIAQSTEEIDFGGRDFQGTANPPASNPIDFNI